ncbi:MAG: nucleotidyltransferase family protein [Rhodothermales bacterium]
MPERRSISEIQEMLHQEFPSLSSRYNVSSIGLFGSYVRHEQRDESDLDVLVEFDETPSLLKFIELENHLSDLLGIQVDLVMKDALKPRVRPRIMDEIVMI